MLNLTLAAFRPRSLETDMTAGRKCWHCNGIMKRNKRNDGWTCIEHGCSQVTAQPVGTNYYTPVVDSEQHGMGGGMRRMPTNDRNN